MCADSLARRCRREARRFGRAWRSGSVLAVSLGASAIAGSAPAWAQSSFAVEVSLGGALPIGAAVQDAALLDAELLATSRTGTPGLWTLYPGAGLQAGARVVAGATEFGYQVHVGPWSHAWRDCVGDRSAARMPDGELEDADVQWDCGERDLRRNLGSVVSSALVQHDLTAAQRFRLELARNRVERIEAGETPGGARWEPVAALYAVVGGGVTLASWRVAGAGGSLTAGAHAVGGVGMELPFSRTWGVLLDARYRFAIRGTPASFASTAGHAEARGATVLSAVADWSQQVGVTVALRYSFR